MFMTIHEMQMLCRAAIDYISSVIKPEMSLSEVRRLCEEYMLCHGADSFWYWDVGAFVFSGKTTAVSVSGRDYTTPDLLIQSEDIITIDLSPQKNLVWGDFARTVVIQNGKAVGSVREVKNEEWRNGLLTEDELHQTMLDFVTSETTFEELFYYINNVIIRKGYVNLDFLGNLGHSIETEKSKRIYIEKGNKHKLSEVAFTFEPHIAKLGSCYGFKKENIYGFINGTLTEL